jgi:hypothetical protein
LFRPFNCPVGVKARWIARFGQAIFGWPRL